MFIRRPELTLVDLGVEEGLLVQSILLGRVVMLSCDLIVESRH